MVVLLAHGVYAGIMDDASIYIGVFFLRNASIQVRARATVLSTISLAGLFLKLDIGIGALELALAFAILQFQCLYGPWRQSGKLDFLKHIQFNRLFTSKQELKSVVFL
jgi:hypothetical protein